MVLLLSCEHYSVSSYISESDICNISAIQWKITCCCFILLICVGLFVSHKWKLRCHVTLLTFHNLRATVALLLLAINTLELARAFLPWPQTTTQIGANFRNNQVCGNDVKCTGIRSRSNLSIPVINSSQQQSDKEDGDQILLFIDTLTLALNAFSAIFLTIALMWYHRIVELKKITDFLYASSCVEVLIFAFRIYILSEVTYDENIFELESSLQALTALCLLSLAAIDGFTLYKERYKLDYLEDYDKIGYQHTLATFYSKICFWWLTPLLWYGYKEPLELNDLGQMRIEDSARAHYDRFLLIYKTAQGNEECPPSMWLCYIRSSWRMFTLGGILKLFGDLFALAGPLAIQQIVQYIETMYRLHSAILLQHYNGNNSNIDGVSGNNITLMSPMGVGNFYKNSIDNRISINATAIEQYSLPTMNGYGVNGNFSNASNVKIYYSSWRDLLSNGWAIAWIVLLAAFIQGTLSQSSTHILNMTGIRIKTSLQGLIYRKTLLLHSSCIESKEMRKIKIEDDFKNAEMKAQRNINSEKNDFSDIGSITNLMSEDTLNIMSFFWIVHYVWAIPLKITVVIYLLYDRLGISAVIGSFVCILVMTPLQFLIGKAMSSNGEVMAKFTDQRLRKIHDSLIGIKLIKLHAWDQVFLKKIRAARKTELKYLNKDSLYWTLMTILTYMSTVLIAVVTLGVYFSLEDVNPKVEFTASHLFSALALFQQMTVPLLIFPITVPIIISAIVSTKRLEAFLQAREIHKQFEGIRHMARILSRSDASLDMYEVKSSLNHNDSDEMKKQNVANDRVALRIYLPDAPAPLARSEPHTPVIIESQELSSNCCTKASSDKPFICNCANECERRIIETRERKLSLKRKDLLRKTPYVLIRPRKLPHTNLSHGKKFDSSLHRDSLLLKMPDDLVVSMTEAYFVWNTKPHQANGLYINDVAVPKGRLTIIVGKNNSGKTSLLSALLMEMPLKSGEMIWNKTSTIAYVPQHPWLLNASIRENILFGESFRPKRYDLVLEACALKPDIELMPQADLTIIGQRGVNLSGGQRQRVTIARALYSSANIVIMDDPLSSLDNEVSRHIFEQCIKGMLLKANRTVILVTQHLYLAQQADYLIVMKDGCLQVSGSYKDIEIKHPEMIIKWNSIIARTANSEKRKRHNAAVERTARERWKLFKNISKLGLQHSATIPMATSAAAYGGEKVDSETDIAARIIMENVDSDDILSQPSCYGGVHFSNNFALTRRRSSVYGSRHLIYEVPLPIDECQGEDVIMRRRRKSDSFHNRRSNSHMSSRLSSNSTVNSSEIAQSMLTASCNSSVSNTSNKSRPMDFSNKASSRECANSWQPQNVRDHQHQFVTRNISLPVDFRTAQPSDIQQECEGTDLVELTRTSYGGFQKFLHRMSMRRASKSSTSSMHRLHRPVSATNSILSITEEKTTSPSITVTPLPSIELTSVATDPTNPEVTVPESWLSDFEDELCEQNANIDYKMLTHVSQKEQLGLGKSSVDVLPVSCSMPANDLLLAPHNPSIRITAKSSTSKDVERVYGKISSQIYLLYLRASGLSIVLVFCITALIWQCLRFYMDVWLQQWTDDYKVIVKNDIDNGAGISAMRNSNISAVPVEAATHHQVTYYFHVYIAISCVCIIMAMISTTAGQIGGCNARRRLHDKLLQTIMQKSLHFFEVTPLGGIMNRFSYDISVIDKKIAATSQRFLQFTLLCLCAVLVNVSITPWFILFTIPICVIYYAIQKFYRCSARELQRIENSTNSPVISHLSDTIEGVTTIRAYNQEARFTEILFERLESNTTAFIILNTSNRWLGISLDYLGGVIVFVAIVTALLAATISCNNHLQHDHLHSSESYDNINNDTFIHDNKYVSKNSIYRNNGTDMQEQKQNQNSSFFHLSPSPSLVGLAINYTLLVPIYLNWVVKLLADMEMYVGSVERIAHYAKAEMKTESEIISDDDDDDNDNDDDNKGGNVDDDYDNSVASGRVKSSDKDISSSVVDDKLTADATDGTTATAPKDYVKITSEKQRENTVAMKGKVFPTISTLMGHNQGKRRGTGKSMQNRHSTRVLYQAVPISWPQRGNISFEDVSLRYEGQTEDVIRNLTLKIPAGQRIGICGRTGSGKSSLALSLFGVLQTTSGRIRIDDVDIAQIHPDEIRTRLSIIPQDVHLFNSTIRENLDPAGYYSDLALWNCLEMAQLKEFINEQLPEGLDTEITDGGCNFSTGYRQLFCLARAILRGSVCLILDEATSSMDITTERTLFSAAYKAFQGRTVLTIAHRLSTILEYDRVIILDNGQIIEDGDPRELQQRVGGAFQTLIRSGKLLPALSKNNGTD